MFTRRRETVDYAEVARHNAEVSQYHGAPDVEKALGFSNLANFYGQRILSIGDVSDRWNITERMRGQGAEVTVVDTYTDGNPIKRVRPSSSVFAGKKFDRAVVAMTSAFRSPKGRVELFQAIVRKVDFKNKGRMGVTALDFGNFEEDAAGSDNQTVRDIADLNKRFFEAVGFDRNSGRNLAAEVGEAIKGKKNLQVEVEVNDRPKGKEHWDEVKDLLAFQINIIDKAVKSMPAFMKQKAALLTLRAEIVALQPSINEILALPVEDRPDALPPRIYRAVVTQKDA